MNRMLVIAAAVLSAVIVAPDVCRAGSLVASASCADGSHISLDWTYYEDPATPTGHPEWVGYDVLRRSMSDCGPLTRVNAEPFPRTLGITQSFTYTETPPAMGVTFQYRVITVDASRQEIFIDYSTCEGASCMSWASCPAFSAPLTQGTLTDLGWALNVNPCAGTCYFPYYFYGPKADELRPYAGTGTVLRLYGQAGCGSVEGCAIDIDHYDIAPCSGPTPEHRSTWGRVKVLYR